MRDMWSGFDIRGIYPDEIDELLAEKVADAVSTLLGEGTIVVGRDVRIGSDSLSAALAVGFKVVGRSVIDIGLATTPMFYFFVKTLSSVAGGIMTTASHNPPEYNGFKVMRRDGTIVAASEINKTLIKL